MTKHKDNMKERTFNFEKSAFNIATNDPYKAYKMR